SGCVLNDVSTLLVLVSVSPPPSFEASAPGVGLGLALSSLLHAAIPCVSPAAIASEHKKQEALPNAMARHRREFQPSASVKGPAHVRASLAWLRRLRAVLRLVVVAVGVVTLLTDCLRAIEIAFLRGGLSFVRDRSPVRIVGFPLGLCLFEDWHECLY